MRVKTPAKDLETLADTAFRAIEQASKSQAKPRTKGTYLLAYTAHQAYAALEEVLKTELGVESLMRASRARYDAYILQALIGSIVSRDMCTQWGPSCPREWKKKAGVRATPSEVMKVVCREQEIYQDILNEARSLLCAPDYRAAVELLVSVRKYAASPQAYRILHC